MFHVRPLTSPCYFAVTYLNGSVSYVSDLPCQGCRGLCCGPVPVSKTELKEIKKKVKAMPQKLRANLRNQPRPYGTCMFYDMERDMCGIYSVRPGVCRAFGHHENLVCFRKPEVAVKPSWNLEEPSVGLLTWDITWKDFDSV
jgi:uncharacterized protein